MKMKLLRREALMAKKAKRWAKAKRKKGGQCVYCRCALTTAQPQSVETSATIDHIIPRARGGLDRIENYALCCYACNQLKADRLVSQVFA